MNVNSSSKPTYSLEEMKKLVSEGDYALSARAAGFLMNRYEVDPEVIVEAVFEDLTDDDFVKSFELNNMVGTMADVYIGGCYDETEWYVKAFINKSGLKLQIWSMCWDGSAH